VDIEDEILKFLAEEKKLSSAVQVMHFHPDKNFYTGESQRFARDVTGLHLAATFGLQHITNYLLENGANVKATDSLGATALHNAAQGGHDDVVSLLLENGADVQAQDSKGHTALHRATQSGSRSVVLLLLENGASISKGVDGRTALHFAAEFGNEVNTQLF
jgi:ankyrin repeat protein